MIILRNKIFTANLPAVVSSPPAAPGTVKPGFKLGTAGKVGLAGAATLGTLYMGKKLLGNKKKEENNYVGTQE